MKEDYLWDKSGDVDTQIEELENVLGRLRYHTPAQPLPLPAITRPWWRLNSAMLAAAAAVLLLLLAGGLLLKLQHTGSSKVEISAGPSPTPGPVDPIGNQPTAVLTPKTEEIIPPAPENIVIPRAPVQRNRFIPAKYYKDTRNEREAVNRRGEYAKAQLFKALQITSAKLNIVQKMIQGSHPTGPIS